MREVLLKRETGKNNFKIVFENKCKILYNINITCALRFLQDASL